MNNEQAWEEKYQEGYGNNYVESHIVRLYFHLLRREFGLKSGKMFDWGMGNGLNAEFFSRQGLEVSGCDVSASAVEQARLRMPTRAQHFHVVTPEDDSFGINGGGYDLLLANESIYYLDDEQIVALCGTVSAALAPDGLFLVTWIGKEHYYFDWAEPRAAGLYLAKIHGRQNEEFLMNFKSDAEAVQLLSQHFVVRRKGYYDMLIDEGRRLHYWYLLQRKV